MDQSVVSLLTSARQRLTDDSPVSAIPAVLDAPDGDVLVQAFKILFGISTAQPNIGAYNGLDLAIAAAADQEHTTNDLDPRITALADYLVGAIGSLPQPIPRILLQHLGQALVSANSQPTRHDAVQYLLDHYQFA